MRRVVLQVEETSAYCTVNHRALASNYQLSNMKRPARDSKRRPQRLEARTLTATSGWTIRPMFTQVQTTSRNRLNLTLLYILISTYFLYFKQFSKLSFNKSIDFSRILCLFITTAIFTGSGSFWKILNVENTVIRTGMKYNSSRKVFMIYWPTVE